MQEGQTIGSHPLEPLPEPFELTEQQQQVYDALTKHSGEKWRFGDWYYGALQVIRAQGPDYLAQAANSIREIAEKLPELAGIDQPPSPFNKTKAAVATILKLSAITQSAPPDNHLLEFKVHHLRM